MTELAIASSPTSIREYLSKRQSLYSDDDARVIGPALEQIEEPTPDNVVDAAADESSPLHPYLEWDDGIAGRNFRVLQASHMLRSIVVKTSTTAAPVPVVPTAIAIKRRTDDQDDEPGDHHEARHIAVVVDGDNSKFLVQRAKRELSDFYQRYIPYWRTIPEFRRQLAPIIEAIEEIS